MSWTTSCVTWISTNGTTRRFDLRQYLLLVPDVFADRRNLPQYSAYWSRLGALRHSGQSVRALLAQIVLHRRRIGRARLLLRAKCVYFLTLRLTDYYKRLTSSVDNIQSNKIFRSSRLTALLLFHDYRRERMPLYACVAAVSWRMLLCPADYVERCTSLEAQRILIRLSTEIIDAAFSITK